ncbi:hypothetical protein [Halalkalicoccus salilacus]|uniref:hypothetical protein n=1 Tax=Halalkalicoccus salilacus TaxID=3117459 RepID=UPI00300E9386
MASDQTKLIAGAALLVLSTILLMAAGLSGLVPLVLAGVATAGLALGSLLIGTTGKGRAV